MSGEHLAETIRGFSLKRLAWAFGCARKGSEEESKLREALISAVLDVVDNRSRIELLESGGES